jgi:uncharacterized oligopeptide transporter (OPT) family protein
MSDRLSTAAAAQCQATTSAARRWLPRIGSPAYHLLLACVAILILGPLGGISAAFMNFSIGFFVGGQVLAGILGSAVTLPYGPEGKHGANYMQTMAASVAGMCAMSSLVQAMVWLGLPQPPAWQLVLYFLCIGMFGVGVGMLYTPILVDRLQLTYPSGLAVANILRALTDKGLLRRSIAKLGGSMVLGYAGSVAAVKIATVGALGVSVSTLGGGMIVGARIAIPALLVALIGRWQTPHLVDIGWLGPGDPYRKIGFIISLGGILGAASLDLGVILVQTLRRLRSPATASSPPAEDWRRVNLFRLVLWVVFWGAGTVWVGSQVLHQPVFFLVVAVVLCLLFVLTNGIALGISDFNPISSAFVMSVFILAALGLRDPGVGMLCAAILSIATSEGGDMQQDRSTGWRLGTNRLVQFRYQVIGIVAGAVLAVALAKLFMSAYPILTQDQFTHPHLEGAQRWQSAYTFKMVGALRGITRSQPHVMKALALGIALGLVIELARKLVKGRRRYKEFVANSRFGRTGSFLLDAVFLPSPYAYAFGGFVEFITVIWWTAGGVGASTFDAVRSRLSSRNGQAAEGEMPADMSTMSLVGGGLIAGDAMAALTLGLYGLLIALL